MSVYCCSDLHGYYELYEQINNFLKPDDIVYFLGDAGDRGPQSWKLIKAIYFNPKWIYIKGNHEDMLIKALRDYWSDEPDPLHYDISLCFSNGGKPTFYDAIAEENAKEWIVALNELPYKTTYINQNKQTIFLSHAGWHPTEDITYHNLIWDREHCYFENWPKEKHPSTIVVHGHTPNPVLARVLDVPHAEGNAFWYCHSHKVDIDCGTYSTGKAMLLDLDTFEEYTFSI